MTALIAKTFFITNNMTKELTIHQRLNIIEHLATINVDCEPNLNDIKFHLSELKQQCFDKDDLEEFFNAGKRSFDTFDERFEKFNKW